LKDIGYGGEDVMELLFWCVTNHKVDGKNHYISFKIQDKDVKRTALTGD